MEIYPITFIRYKYSYIDDKKFNSYDSIYVKGEVSCLVDCISIVNKYLSNTDLSKTLIEIDDYYTLTDRLIIT